MAIFLYGKENKFLPNAHIIKKYIILVDMVIFYIQVFFITINKADINI